MTLGKLLTVFKLQWKLLNVITLGQPDNINQMITLADCIEYLRVIWSRLYWSHKLNDNNNQLISQCSTTVDAA
jgi:hypothetical protein